MPWPDAPAPRSKDAAARAALWAEIRAGPWAHPTAEWADPERPGGARVMDDEQWRAYKKMIARLAKERAKAKKAAARAH